MLTNGEIAAAMAENMSQAAVPLYGKNCICRIGTALSALSRSCGGCSSRRISARRS